LPGGRLPSLGGAQKEKRMLTVIPDSEAHEPGCIKADSGVECADPNLTYLDIFCECHRYTEPKILSNGTDIAWPAGWSQTEADDWRQAHGLKMPLIS
jgi:hypothetical protein